MASTPALAAEVFRLWDKLSLEGGGHAPPELAVANVDPPPAAGST